MKRIIISAMSLLIMAQSGFSQSVEEGVKSLYYKRNKAAKATFQKVLAAKPNDVTATYWLGQVLIAEDEVAAAKLVYQQALQSVGSEALLLVGMGQIDLLEGGDINAAKQKFEQAITATKNKKGVENVEILTAIARANAGGSSKVGDPAYGVEKAKRAAEIDAKNAESKFWEGVNYLKMGGERGGDAVQAFTDAIARNPNKADAYYRIGRIYQSQNNKEAFDKWYADALRVDASYPDVYLAYFQYFEDKDINRAKEYLDKFIANSEQDCITDYFAANYLFRAGKYQESLDKAKVMAEGDCKNAPRVNILYAYNYDRLGDSLKAKDAIDAFFVKEVAAKIQPDDYIIASKIYNKFPSQSDKALEFLNKAAEVDTVVKNKIGYYNDAAALLVKAGKQNQAFSYVLRGVQLKGTQTSEADYYKLAKMASDAVATAPDFYPTADSIAKAYIAAYPDKPQGYTFRVIAAKKADIDSTKGLFIEPITQQNEYYAKDIEKNRKSIFGNHYFMLVYYNDKAKDTQKAIEMTDKMIELYPNAGEENTFATSTKAALTAQLNRPKPQPKQPAAPKATTPKTGGAATKSSK